MNRFISAEDDLILVDNAGVENVFCKTGKGGGRNPKCGKGKRVPVAEVKRGSKDYQKLSERARQRVLDRDIDAYEAMGSFYRSVKTPGYKRLAPERIAANREIGMLEGKARAYLDRAEAFTGSDRRELQNIGLNFLEQAHDIHETAMKARKK